MMVSNVKIFRAVTIRQDYIAAAIQEKAPAIVDDDAAVDLISFNVWVFWTGAFAYDYRAVEHRSKCAPLREKADVVVAEGRYSLRIFTDRPHASACFARSDNAISCVTHPNNASYSRAEDTVARA